MHLWWCGGIWTDCLDHIKQGLVVVRIITMRKHFQRGIVAILVVLCRPRIRMSIVRAQHDQYDIPAVGDQGLVGTSIPPRVAYILLQGCATNSEICHGVRAV